MMRHFHSLVFVTIAGLFLAGCGEAPLHNPVPEELSEQAMVPGFAPDIRFWADEAPDNLTDVIAERVAEYRKTNSRYYEVHGKYPPLHYLAISGGAYDGAFGAGLLHGWSKMGTRPEFAMVTGVSTGALIAPFVFIGPKYDEELRELYTKTSSENIFSAGPLSVLEGITGGLSLTDSTPLATRIKETITKDILAEIAAEHRKGKRLFIGTTNIEAQRGVIWDIGAIANSGHPRALRLVHQVMLASASVPGLFQPVFIDVKAGGKKFDEIHTDGGVTSQVFVYPLRLRRSVIDAFKRYRLDRHLYIVRNSKITPEYHEFNPGFFSLSARSIQTLTKSQGIGDLYRLYVGTQRDDVDFNLVHIPASFKEKPEELFDPVYMRKLFDLGAQMGRDQSVWLKKPPGVDYVPANTPVPPAPGEQMP